jgi:hypothetical protein
MGKGTLDLKAEKIELKYQYAQKMKKYELFYKLWRWVIVVCEFWEKKIFPVHLANFHTNCSIDI